MIAPYCAEMEVASTAAPAPVWLGALLKGGPLYLDNERKCKRHAGRPNTVLKHFCIDCKSAPLCNACVVESHDGHHVLQVRRCSRHSSVHIADMEHLLNLETIHPYTINNDLVVFLNGRPQEKPQPASFHCETCERQMESAFRFCSIGCKLAAMAAGDRSLTLLPSERALALARDLRRNRKPVIRKKKSTVKDDGPAHKKAKKPSSPKLKKDLTSLKLKSKERKRSAIEADFEWSPRVESASQRNLKHVFEKMPPSPPSLDDITGSSDDDSEQYFSGGSGVVQARQPNRPDGEDMFTSASEAEDERRKPLKKRKIAAMEAVASFEHDTLPPLSDEGSVRYAAFALMAIKSNGLRVA